jgi:general stress protein 26
LQESGGIDLIFHTNTESGKTDDISSDNAINIAFLNSTGEWASISGKASIITDRATVKRYYSPALKAWLGDLGDGTHDGGEDDPRMGVIRVEAKTATYQIARKTMVGRAVEMVQGVLTGDVPAIGKLREISEKEINEWRSSH